MRKHFLLTLQFFVIALLVIWHTMLGINMDLYWQISWWDIVSHILGGLWVGLCVAWLGLVYKIRISILQCVLAAFAVGVAWEIFEYVTHMGGSPFMSYQVDTIKDLVDDVLGGALAGYIVRHTK